MSAFDPKRTFVGLCYSEWAFGKPGLPYRLKSRRVRSLGLGAGCAFGGFLLTNESPQDCREAMHLPRLKFPVTTNRGKEKPSDHTPVWCELTD